MDINGLNKRLKEISDFDAEKEIYRFIKSDISHLLLQANYEQIFIRSEDIFGYPLGYYKNNYNSDKKKGRPYSMVDSGYLEKFMFIDVRYRRITIGSSALSGLMFEKENDTKIFGVQERTLNSILNKWIIPHLKKKLSFN